MPRPPTWMSERMIPWPKIVKSWGVSRTISPVTQVALVDVKRASIGEIPSGPGEAAGRVSRIVPTRMMKINEETDRFDRKREYAEQGERGDRQQDGAVAGAKQEPEEVADREGGGDGDGGADEQGTPSIGDPVADDCQDQHERREEGVTGGGTVDVVPVLELLGAAGDDEPFADRATGVEQMHPEGRQLPDEDQGGEDRVVGEGRDEDHGVDRHDGRREGGPPASVGQLGHGGGEGRQPEDAGVDRAKSGQLVARPHVAARHVDRRQHDHHHRRGDGDAYGAE